MRVAIDGQHWQGNFSSTAPIDLNTIKLLAWKVELCCTLAKEEEHKKRLKRGYKRVVFSIK